MRQARAVGWTRWQQLTHQVYEALVPQVCGACGRTIQPGERFTRRIHAGHRQPVCQTCVPLGKPISGWL